MTEDTPSTNEKAAKVRTAFDAFMEQMRGLEHERLEVMKGVISELEREEIERLLQELKD